MYFGLARTLGVIGAMWLSPSGGAGDFPYRYGQASTMASLRDAGSVAG